MRDQYIQKKRSRRYRCRVYGERAVSSGMKALCEADYDHLLLTKRGGNLILGKCGPNYCYFNLFVQVFAAADFGCHIPQFSNQEAVIISEHRLVNDI